jgi:uncharacterized protein (TIGR03437 family)
MRIASILWLFAACAALPAQTPPVSILDVQAENMVTYYDDTSDVSRWGTLPGPVPLPASFTNPTFKWRITLADLVSVNGQPIKGNFVSVTRSVNATTDMTPGRVLMDLALGCPFEQIHSFMLPDGTVIGTIAALGANTAGRPPGAPNTALAGTGVLVGGSGAFLGIRGQAGLTGGTGARNASITEDPAYRRLNGGGKMSWFIQIVPTVWPEVLTVLTGPAIFHGADSSPVTLEKPARAGELLIMSVSGLGPVKGKLDPGQPFPAGNLLEVNSPVDVTVNGKRAEVVNKIGWPTMTNVYRVDFVVPGGTAPGMASVVPAVAWINGSEAKIPVR